MGRLSEHIQIAIVDFGFFGGSRLFVFYSTYAVTR